jgi:hypothetical protein
MVSRSATGAPIWLVAEAEARRFTSIRTGVLRILELTAHGNRTTQVYGSSESANLCTTVELSLLNSRPKRAQVWWGRITANDHAVLIGSRRVVSAAWSCPMAPRINEQIPLEMSDSCIGCFNAVSMVSRSATGAPIWAVAEAEVRRFADVAGVFKYFGAHSAWKPYNPGL